MDHLISLINWGGRSSGSKHAFHRAFESTRHTVGIQKKHSWLKHKYLILWLRTVPAHHRSKPSVVFSGDLGRTGSLITITKMKKKDTILKQKWHWSQIWPQFILTPSILRDTWSWNLRYMNWVASIWPQSNSIFLPTLVGLQTTKDPRELMRIEWESKRIKNLENTFNVVQNLILLASILVWSCSNSLQKWIRNGKKLWILEFLNLQIVRFKLNFQVKIIRFSFELWGFEKRGQSWRARCVWNELQGIVFIAFESVICTLEKLLKLARWCTSLHGRVQAHEAIQFDPYPTVLKFKWGLSCKAMICGVLDIWFSPMMQLC